MTQKTDAAADIASADPNAKWLDAPAHVPHGLPGGHTPSPVRPEKWLYEPVVHTPPELRDPGHPPGSAMAERDDVS